MPTLMPAARARTPYVPLEPPSTFIPVAIYTFGLCHYGAKTPYKTVDVPEASKHRAAVVAWQKLIPNICEQVILIETRPNPAHVATRQQSMAV